MPRKAEGSSQQNKEKFDYILNAENLMTVNLEIQYMSFQYNLEPALIQLIPFVIKGKYIVKLTTFISTRIGNPNPESVQFLDTESESAICNLNC